MLRGVMFDMARVTERWDVYRRWPARLARFGYDTVLAHVTDDEGCAVHFPRRPGLATPYALTSTQWRQWLRRCRRFGIQVIPEIECFGHTRYIHGHPAYRHLSLGGKGVFNAIDATHADAQAVLRDLLQDAAAMTDAPFIHAGFDEVAPGDDERVAQLTRERSWADLFADHIAFAQAQIEAASKRMMMWSDHLLNNDVLLARVSRNIIVCDWQYGAQVNGESVEKLIDAGFEVICCPASSRAGEIVAPGPTTQMNLQRFARVAAGRSGVVGAMNTVWCPPRMLFGATDFAVALGGQWFHDPEAEAAPTIARFAGRRYGIDADAAEPIAQAILSLSTLAPSRAEFKRALALVGALADEPRAPALRLTDYELGNDADRRERLARLRLTFEGTVVRFHPREFELYALACDLMTWLIDCAEAGSCSLTSQRPRLAERGSKLLRRLDANWALRAHEEDPKRYDEALPGQDSVLPNVRHVVDRLSSVS